MYLGCMYRPVCMRHCSLEEFLVCWKLIVCRNTRSHAHFSYFSILLGFIFAPLSFFISCFHFFFSVSSSLFFFVHLQMYPCEITRYKTEGEEILPSHYLPGQLLRRQKLPHPESQRMCSPHLLPLESPKPTGNMVF